VGVVPPPRVRANDITILRGEGTPPTSNTMERDGLRVVLLS